MTWSVAIFSSRETPAALLASLTAAIDATPDEESTIDIVINGNRALADEVGERVKSLRGGGAARKVVRVWFLRVADKAHAWNQYVHHIWPGSTVAYFVDGYVQVMPDALAHIGKGMAATPKALGASGVPTMGRSAKRLQKQPGAHGNLCAVRGDALAQLREMGFRLPVGIYWIDGILFAVICFGLDPSKNKWESDRLLVCPQATWAFQPLRWWSATDVKAHLKRIMRQAQGVLENRAVRELFAVQRKSALSFPGTSSELVWSWLRAFPLAAAKAFIRNPLSLLAARRLQPGRRDWSGITTPPLLIAEMTFHPGAADPRPPERAGAR
jgi:hypothetical protein